MVIVYKQFLDSLRKSFVLQQKYQDKAQAFLQKVKTDSKLYNPTFISIHNRRGDCNFTIKSYRGNLVGRNYFDLAVRVFRENIKDAVLLLLSAMI